MFFESNLQLLFLGLFALAAGAAVAAVIVFLCALPFLLRPSRTANRFGPASANTGVGPAVVSGLRRGLDMYGRSSPADFWFFAVFVALVSGLAVAGTAALAVVNRASPGLWSAVPLIVLPVLAIPSLTVAVRRLHDVNRSGWWLLLLGVFGYFVLLYWIFQPSQSDTTAQVFE